MYLGQFPQYLLHHASGLQSKRGVFVSQPDMEYFCRSRKQRLYFSGEVLLSDLSICNADDQTRRNITVHLDEIYKIYRSD